MVVDGIPRGLHDKDMSSPDVAAQLDLTLTAYCGARADRGRGGQPDGASELLCQALAARAAQNHHRLWGPDHRPSLDCRLDLQAVQQSIPA